ncbi:hypothetical protein SAMN04487761_1389 [Lachnospiraceae bacterium C7]|nr:hypothetical protein SAMN04487761_1389 [Lachnospiraceae bacterium C7]
MSEVFYLNPTTIKDQCKAAISRADSNRDIIQNTKQYIEKFIGDKSIKSEKFDNFKIVMGDYLIVAMAMSASIIADIDDYNSLINKVGDEILDSEDMNAQLAKCQSLINKTQSSIDKINEECKENNYSFGKDMSSSDELDFKVKIGFTNYYNKQLDMYKQLQTNLIKNVADKYHQIENDTKGLFETGRQYENNAKGLLKQLNGTFVDGQYQPIVESEYRNNLLTDTKINDLFEEGTERFFERKGIKKSRLNDLKNYGFSSYELYTYYCGTKNKKFVIDFIKGNKKSYREAFSIDPDKLDSYAKVFYADFVSRLWKISMETDDVENTAGYKARNSELNILFNALFDKNKDYPEDLLKENLLMYSHDLYVVQSKITNDYSKKYLDYLENYALLGAQSDTQAVVKLKEAGLGDDGKTKYMEMERRKDFTLYLLGKTLEEAKKDFDAREARSTLNSFKISEIKYLDLRKDVSTCPTIKYSRRGNSECYLKLNISTTYGEFQEMTDKAAVDKAREDGPHEFRDATMEILKDIVITGVSTVHPALGIVTAMALDAASNNNCDNDIENLSLYISKQAGFDPKEIKSQFENEVKDAVNDKTNILLANVTNKIPNYGAKIKFGKYDAEIKQYARQGAVKMNTAFKSGAGVITTDTLFNLVGAALRDSDFYNRQRENEKKQLEKSKTTYVIHDDKPIASIYGVDFNQVAAWNKVNHGHLNEIVKSNDDAADFTQKLDEVKKATDQFANTKYKEKYHVKHHGDGVDMNEIYKADKIYRSEEQGQTVKYVHLIPHKGKYEVKTKLSSVEQEEYNNGEWIKGTNRQLKYMNAMLNGKGTNELSKIKDNAQGSDEYRAINELDDLFQRADSGSTNRIIEESIEEYRIK